MIGLGGVLKNLNRDDRKQYPILLAVPSSFGCPATLAYWLGDLPPELGPLRE